MNSWKKEDKTLKRDTILAIIVLLALFISPPIIMLYEHNKDTVIEELDHNHLISTPSDAVATNSEI